MLGAMKNSITIFEKEPSNFAVRKYTNAEKRKIVSYMKSFDPFAAMGMVEDCVTGKRRNEENVGYTDGVFAWSSQDIYHIEEYDAAVADSFFNKIMQ